MVSVSLVCVVTLATLGFVAMHPTDDRNTKKYTKEYIDSELQKTDLEPALLMEYLTQLMGKDTGDYNSRLHILINKYSVLMCVCVDLCSISGRIINNFNASVSPNK